MIQQIALIRISRAASCKTTEQLHSGFELDGRQGINVVTSVSDMHLIAGESQRHRGLNIGKRSVPGVAIVHSTGCILIDVPRGAKEYARFQGIQKSARSQRAALG